MDRFGCVVAAAIGTVLMLALGLWHAGNDYATGLDKVAADAVGAALADRPGILRVLVLATEPYVLLPVLAVATAVCVRLRRWQDTVLVLLGPSVAIALTSWLLKPLFARHLDGHLAYPSGHTVALVSTMTALAVVLRHRRFVWAIACLGIVLLAGVAVGMVGLRYHYLTDVVGGACLGVAVVLTVTLVLAALAAQLPERDRGQPRSDQA